MKYRNNTIFLLLLVIAAIFAVLYFLQPAHGMLHIPPHIRKILWSIFFVSGTALLVIYLQPLLKGSPDAIPINGLLKGRLIDYHTNRIGDVDKLLLESKQLKYWVHFPPHTAKFVMKAAAKNDTVSIVISPSDKKTIDGQAMEELVSIQSTTASFLVASVPPPLPATGKKIEISGKAGQYKIDEKGIVAGMILDGYLVDIPPHLVQNILPVIKEAQQIIIKGYQRNADDGFVNSTGLILVKPYAISIDKTDYLL